MLTTTAMCNGTPNSQSHPQGKVLSLLDPSHWSIGVSDIRAATQHIPVHKPALTSGDSCPIPPQKLGNCLSLPQQRGTKHPVTRLGPDQRWTPTAFWQRSDPSSDVRAGAQTDQEALEVGRAQTPLL